MTDTPPPMPPSTPEGRIGGPSPPVPTTPEGRYLGILNAIRSLTLQNVLIIALLAIIAVPAYVVWAALHDEELLDRFFSTYREISAQNIGCSIREAKYRGGAPSWAIGTGYAFIGRDRYIISVVLDHEPSASTGEIESYCEALKLMADKMLAVRGVAGDDDAAVQ